MEDQEVGTLTELDWCQDFGEYYEANISKFAEGMKACRILWYRVGGKVLCRFRDRIRKTCNTCYARHALRIPE